MSNKLELKDIACYLPYGVKCRLNRTGIFNLDEEYPQPHNEICEITNLLKCNNEWEVEISGEDMDYSYGMIGLDEIDILLRPMTDLIKPLPDGTIPIVELAKIEGHVDTSDEDYKLGSYILDTYGVRFNIENDEDDNEYEVFGWDSVNGFGVHYRPSERIRIVGNQRQLWQYLYAHHFDINNLICRGLAIDANTVQD